MPLFTGKAIAEQKSERRWNPQRGWELVRHWVGIPEDIQRVMHSEAAFATSVESTPEGAYMALRITYGILDDGSPVTDQVQTVWELAGNDLEKSLWELPDVQAEIAKLLPAAVANTHKVVEDELVKFTPWDEVPFPVVSAPLQELYKALQHGVTSYPLSQFVLRRTQTVNPGSSIKPNYAHVGKMLTSSKLKNDEAIPDAIQFVLPDGFWLKRTPTVIQQGTGKFQITNEWWNSAEYSQLIYGPALT